MNTSLKSKKRKSRLLLNCLFVFLLVAGLLVFFSVIDAYPDVTSSPLYVDLFDNEVYARRGFDAGILEISDLDTLRDMDAMEWESVTPPEYTGDYLMQKLVAPSPGRTHTLFHPAEFPYEEFTLMIPFELSAEAMTACKGANAAIPGLYLSGIGTNWEVFINGERVAAEVHLDDNGNIESYRSMRGVNLPINDRLLNEGTNVIVFRIITAYGSTDAGLFYSSGYYIGDYSDIKTRSMNTLTVIFSTIYIFMGMYHLLMFYMRRVDRYNLAYCFFTILIALYFMSRTPMIYALTRNTAITQRLEYSAMYVLPFALAVFLESLSFNKLTIFTKIYGVICAALVVIQALVSIDFSSSILRVGQFLVALMVLHVVLYDTLLTLIKRIRARRRADKEDGTGLSAGMTVLDELANTSLGNILLAVVFLSFTATFDILDAVVFHIGLLLSRYSFFLFTVSAAFVLARKFADAFNRMNEENETLEAAVRARTAELEEQVQIAEFASRAKGDFLANMSHEIRTPINAVIGMTTIGRGSDDVVKKDYSFEKIADASTHLLGVINDILDMSKIEANKLELSPVEFNVRETAKHVTDIMRIRMDEKAQEFAMEFDNDIPAWLEGDDQRLAQVIANLLSNAVKFTPEGGRITFTAHLCSQEGERCVLQFAVRDNGIGISEEQRSRLFTSFGQADTSTSRNYGGTGLGLALSKRIVELMDGEIAVQSEPGIGSEFSFTVVMRSVAMPMAESAAAETEPLGNGELAGFTALLAEDIDVNREIVMTVLEDTGLKFLVAENGQQAVDQFMACADEIDLILMDVQMPVMDGYEATRTIRAMNTPKSLSVPILAMTANVFKEDVDNCIDAGMNAHMGKPLDITELTSLLRRYLLNSGN